MSHSEDLLQPGEYVFIPKREPIRLFHSEPLNPLAGRLRRLRWNWFGQKYEIKQIVELLWPEIDTIVLYCPDCNQPLATTNRHTNVSVEPLTIEAALTCPSTKTHTFKVEQRKQSLSSTILLRFLHCGWETVSSHGSQANWRRS